MTDSGASAAAGSGVTRAIPTAAPARWPAHGPTADELLEMVPIAADDEVPALEVLRAAGAPAGAEDPVEVLRGRAERSANFRTARLVEIACQTDVVRLVGHDAAVRDGAIGGGRRGDAARTGGVRGPRGTRERPRPPEAAVFHGRTAPRRSGMRRGVTAAARSAASAGA